MKYASFEIWEHWKNPDEFENFLRLLNEQDFDRIFYVCLNDFLYFKPEHTFDSLIKAGKNKNKKIEVLVGLSRFIMPEPKSEDFEATYWDSYWLIKTFVNLKRPHQRDEFRYHYVSLNGIAHRWRCEFIDLLAKFNLLEYGAVSWLNEKRGGDVINYDFKYFTPVKMSLTDNYSENKDQYVVPVEYEHSFCQLVSETETRIIEISEKTATPLILGKPFLVAAARDNTKLQTKLGFELYDEIFDYAFDDYVIQTNRFVKLLENISKISTIPLSELTDIYHTLLPKITHNQNRVKEIAYDINAWPEPVQAILKLYDTTGENILPEIVEIRNKLLLMRET